MLTMAERLQQLAEIQERYTVLWREARQAAGAALTASGREFWAAVCAEGEALLDEALAVVLAANHEVMLTSEEWWALNKAQQLEIPPR